MPTRWQTRENDDFFCFEENCSVRFAMYHGWWFSMAFLKRRLYRNEFISRCDAHYISSTRFIEAPKWSFRIQWFPNTESMARTLNQYTHGDALIARARSYLVRGKRRKDKHTECERKTANTSTPTVYWWQWSITRLRNEHHKFSSVLLGFALFRTQSVLSSVTVQHFVRLYVCVCILRLGLFAFSIIRTQCGKTNISIL